MTGLGAAGLRTAVAVGVLTLIVACDAIGSAQDAYPLPNGPPSSHQYRAADVGEPVTAVVLYIRPHQGDKIEFLDAAAIGSTTGADVALYLSRPKIIPNGGVVIGEQLEPLAGSVVTRGIGPAGAEGDVGIVAEVTPRQAGRFEITDVTLSYRLNDGAATQGNAISVTFTVCGGATTCAEADNSTN